MIDPYVYEETGTLKNKLGITDYDKLRQAEADIGFLKLIDIDSIESNRFDSSFLCDLHKHIFEDIFEWAGQYRSVDIYKKELVVPGVSLKYSMPKEISSDLNKLLKDLNDTFWDLDDLDSVALIFARKIAVLWKVHPFRDGNTRTFISFAYLFARSHGFSFDIEKFISQLNRQFNESGKVKTYSVRDKFVLASLEEENHPEVCYLANLFRSSFICKDNVKIDVKAK